MPVGIFDLFTVAVGLIGYLIGRSRGLVWQLSGIATLVIGGLSATILAGPLGPLFAAGILGRFVAWVVVYALVAISLYLLSLRLKHRIEEAEFDELDRRFGGALGAFKGLLAFAVVTLVAVALSTNVKAAVESSASGRGLRALVHELRPLVPERVYDAFGPWLDGVDLDGLDSEGEGGPDPQPVQPGVPSGPSLPAPPQAGAPVREAAPPRAAPQPAPTSPRRAPPEPEARTLGPPPAPLEYPEVPEYEPERETPSAPQPVDDPFDTAGDPPDPLAPPE